MKKTLSNPFALFVLFTVFFVVVIFLSPPCRECLDQQHEKYQQQSTSEHPSSVPALARVQCFMDAIYESGEILTALASVFLAIFTARLFWATDKLASITADLHGMAKQEEQTARTHERAYIVCGGLFGVPKNTVVFLTANEPIKNYYPDAANYGAPWRMQIHNFGRTPGFIKKVTWTTCPKVEFPENVSVTRTLKDWAHKGRPVNMVSVQEVFAPLGKEAVGYRHVSPDRVVGEVFFGRIDYEDVFGVPHHSTFALLHDEHHSTPIGKSFSDDWS